MFKRIAGTKNSKLYYSSLGTFNRNIADRSNFKKEAKEMLSQFEASILV